MPPIVGADAANEQLTLKKSSRLDRHFRFVHRIFERRKKSQVNSFDWLTENYRTERAADFGISIFTIPFSE